VTDIKTDRQSDRPGDEHVVCRVLLTEPPRQLDNALRCAGQLANVGPAESKYVINGFLGARRMSDKNTKYFTEDGFLFINIWTANSFACGGSRPRPEQGSSPPS